MMLDLEEQIGNFFFLEKKGRKGKVDLTKIPFTKQVVGERFPVISMNVDLTLWSPRTNPVLRPAIKSKTSGFEMEGRIED